MDTVVVTGAEAALGRAVATTFADRGATVVVGVRDAAAGDDLVSAHDDVVRSVRADPRDEYDTERLMEQASRAGETSGIDLVAPCAQVYHGPVGETPLDRSTYSAFDDTIRTNTRGVFSAVVEALPHLRPDARVLVPTGGSAHETMGGYGVFAVAAAATEAVVRGFRADRPDLTVAALEVGVAGGTGDFDEATAAEAAALFAWAAERPADALDGERLTLDDLRAASS
jgi:NAD(P)-dependent dehydrogenase (short-subunit alcohol dehydrogenase family)